MKNIHKIFLAFLFICIFSQGTNLYAQARRLIIFESPSCSSCAQVKSELIPQIEKEFGSRITVEHRDIGIPENYKLLLGLLSKYDAAVKDTLPTVYFQGRFLAGKEDISGGLASLIRDALKAAPLSDQGLPPVDLVSKFLAFSPLAVTSAGLIDGINPCAFTVIVFFISFLALQGYRKRQLITIGGSFICVVFLTYLLIGFGLFTFLYRLSSFWVLARLINYLIGGFSIALGGFALYDFFNFRRRGETEGLLLQLPRPVKRKVQALIGSHYRKGGQDGEPAMIATPKLILTSIVTAFLVSILEAVCTGQVYLPTITLVLKTTSHKLSALGYLLTYNFMFILPLIVIFVFALFGTTSAQFASYLKKHLLGIKLAMALLFFALGGFLIWGI
ncbi:cytochrome c biogenesis CcdA family protein [Candidatus Omnitrophota bacterium]